MNPHRKFPASGFVRISGAEAADEPEAEAEDGCSCALHRASTSWLSKPVFSTPGNLAAGNASHPTSSPNSSPSTSAVLPYPRACAPSSMAKNVLLAASPMCRTISGAGEAVLLGGSKAGTRVRTLEYLTPMGAWWTEIFKGGLLVGEVGGRVGSAVAISQEGVWGYLA